MLKKTEKVLIKLKVRKCRFCNALVQQVKSIFFFVAINETIHSLIIFQKIKSCDQIMNSELTRGQGLDVRGLT